MGLKAEFNKDLIRNIVKATNNAELTSQANKNFINGANELCCNNASVNIGMDFSGQ